MDFTKKKFLELTASQQDRFSAEALRRFYEEGSGLEEYNLWQKWLGVALLEDLSSESVANRYHEHLRRCGLHLTEPRLLPLVRQGDRERSLPPIPVGVYLDNLRSAHNVGSILRTCEAFALGTVYFGGKTPFIDNKQVKDTSMGAHEWIACEMAANPAGLPRPIVAVETSSQATSIDDFCFPEECTLAVGNEEVGLSKALLSQADAVIEIPLYGRKNSLNVANAFAVVAAAVRHQYRQKDKRPCPVH